MQISEPQKIIFSLLERERFNNFSGNQVSNALTDNSELWRSVYFTSIGIQQNESGSWVFGTSRNDLISLRDLPNGFMQLDTLLILSSPGAQSELEAIASKWNADICVWVGAEESGRVMGGKRSVREYSENPNQVILYLWWD
jgi:hypothetical protein